MNWKKIAIPVLILISGFIIMRVLLSGKSEPPKKERAVQPRIVDIRVVKFSKIESEITAYGRLQSAQPVILFSEVAGVLQKGDINFRPGQSFKKGDLLVKIDNRQAWLDLNSAKSDFLNALANVLPEIKVDFPEEFREWQEYFNSCNFGQKITSLPEADNQKIKMFLSRFNVFKLFFTVRNLEIRLEKHFFYAPFDGAIITTDMNTGSTARNGTRLGEIINIEDMEVEVPVIASDIEWINMSEPVRFTSSEIDGEWQGEIRRIGKTIDERTQTVPVYISILQNGTDKLFDGIFLTAHIPGKMINNAITIPRKSLYNDKFVYLIKNGKLATSEVSIVRTEVENIIVNDGIANGDTLITELMQGVAPGMPARSRTSLTSGGQN